MTPDVGRGNVPGWEFLIGKVDYNELVEKNGKISVVMNDKYMVVGGKHL